ncbi:hypothetical protein ASF27_05265 [Methylobacterium sp. Leaf102]|uniref:hypothetical protein n=1 Tax=unclassified Methylobacterium TaxID=2615210 RepID=UPI0006FA7274|nr:MULTISPECIES: hypothetical protein [unclassified Methylobacterium]KQP30341.1 hypothetical protein ASF27_05265 [Methylobacterium sp. Leaf102]KQP32271.1 hypothetical protein ASF25_05060 [Methylobacterium sp. Leaf100]
MSIVRRFLVAPSLVRLIRKERGGARVTEGYFAPQAGRVSYVRVDGQQCHLVLVNTDQNGASSEERTDVPRAHGDALLDVCSGKAQYDRTVIALGAGREARVDRYVAPGNLDLVSVTFDEIGDANGFSVPVWFGPEVSGDAAYERHAVALQGVPQPGEIALSNAALEAVLDLVEPRFGFGRYGGASGAAAKPADEDGMMKALRRVAGGGAAAQPSPQAAAPAPVAAPEPAHPEAGQNDARIDEVIESLSQALGNPQPLPPEGEPAQPARAEEAAGEFERWTVRPRRNQT